MSEASQIFTLLDAVALSYIIIVIIGYIFFFCMSIILVDVNVVSY